MICFPESLIKRSTHFSKTPTSFSINYYNCKTSWLLAFAYIIVAFFYLARFSVSKHGFSSVCIELNDRQDGTRKHFSCQESLTTKIHRTKLKLKCFLKFGGKSSNYMFRSKSFIPIQNSNI